MTYELIYFSGHRQIWRMVACEEVSDGFYECITFSPEGEQLEFKVFSSKQLERTIRRVIRSGGEVRKLLTD